MVVTLETENNSEQETKEASKLDTAFASKTGSARVPNSVE